MYATSTAAMKFSVEVIILPVSDIDRALHFYVDQLGFALDVDYAPNDVFRVVQLTPPGSSCSIQIGKGLTDAPAGSLRNLYLVVTDLKAVEAISSNAGSMSATSNTRHPSMPGTEALPPASTLREKTTPASPGFSDPDGNSWVLQERGYRAAPAR